MPHITSFKAPTSRPLDPTDPKNFQRPALTGTIAAQISGLWNSSTGPAFPSDRTPFRQQYGGLAVLVELNSESNLFSHTFTEVQAGDVVRLQRIGSISAGGVPVSGDPGWGGMTVQLTQQQADLINLRIGTERAR